MIKLIPVIKLNFLCTLLLFQGLVLKPVVAEPFSYTEQMLVASDGEAGDWAEIFGVLWRRWSTQERG